MSDSKGLREILATFPKYATLGRLDENAELQADLIAWAKAYGEQVRAACIKDIYDGSRNTIATDVAPLAWAMSRIELTPLPEPKP